MTARTIALGAVAVTLAWPAPAQATHGGCWWGATVDVDPQRPDPVRLGLQPAFWFCPGPVVSVRLGSREPALPPEGSPPADGPPPLRLTLSPRTVRAGRIARVRVRALRIGPPDEPAEGVEVRLGGHSLLTGPDGTAVVRLRARRARRITAVAGEATAALRVLRARRRGQRA